MTAKEFYDKRLKEDETIGSVQLMEEFAELKKNDAISEIKDWLIGEDFEGLAERL